MTAYYNENDPKAAAWLRELIKAGHIAPGDVDDRSILDVTPADVAGYTQCHFFAGIGGWSYALRLAGWSDSREVWTGSCPCQPFSTAGKGAGFADERHLWPAWFHLIRECRPQRVFGEQVANALTWLDLVSTDLEGEGYTFGAAIMGAHSVGAPHIRQRLYWVADDDDERSHGRRARRIQPADGCDMGDAESFDGQVQLQPGRPQSAGAEFGGPSATSNVGDADEPGPQGRRERRDGRDERAPWAASMGIGLEHATSNGRQQWRPESGERITVGGCGENNQPPAQTSFWSAHRSIACTDGKTRIGPIEPEFRPLADGVPGRVGLLRGYGNAIVPQCAAAFIAAYVGARGQDL